MSQLNLLTLVLHLRPYIGHTLELGNSSSEYLSVMCACIDGWKMPLDLLDDHCTMAAHGLSYVTPQVPMVVQPFHISQTPQSTLSLTSSSSVGES